MGTVNSGTSFTFYHRKYQTTQFREIRNGGKSSFITEEFGELLKISMKRKMIHLSCSLAEVLEKQDLFINSTLAQMGSSLTLELISQWID